MAAARSRGTLFALVGLVAGFALPAGALAATAPTLPHVTISPLKGTPDASPSSQISFLGVPAAGISQIVVHGSGSGTHSGKLTPYATGTGVSFMPARPFIPGETVTVTAVETVSHAKQTIGTSFGIGYIYALPATQGHKPKPPALASTVQTFLTMPAVHPPTVSVTTPAADPDLGDLFLTPVDGASQPGAMIVNPAGQLVWFSPAPAGEQNTDLRVQNYLGKSVLTDWQGRITYGHGVGSGTIYNTSYQPIARVAAGNGLSMDLHEFELEPGGIAVISVYEPVWWNLSSVGGPSKAVIEDCVIQEIDVRTGAVMFEWHALGHVPLSASHSPAPRTTTTDGSTNVWDWFHINSINRERNGNFLISSRNTWAVYQLGHSYGEILWTLGGRHSSFKLGSGVQFAWQHDATRLPDGTIEIFDNEDTPPIAKSSRGIDIAISLKTHTATLVHAYLNPTTVLSPSQGDVQQLTNSDQLVGFGQIGVVSEFSPAGAVTFQLTLPTAVGSYRAYRFQWTATPKTPPIAYATRASTTTTTVAASWNGATGVVDWQVLAGASRTTLAAVGSPTASVGLETQVAVATSAPYVAVQAIGAGGTVLGTSAPVQVSAG
ncbi:MAG: arylsulfotransferase family protein [Solirubrobacteraceae bacterium]